MRNHEYILTDILEDTKLNNKLGTYKGDDLLLKKGQFGLYVTWGDNKKSIAGINIVEQDITLDDIISFIENNTNSNIVRELSVNLSIRKGPHGDYIFYKTTKMSKPKFHKLNGFKEDYKICNSDLIKTWIHEIYKIKA